MELRAQKRTIIGSKVKNIRKEGNIPAVVFSKKSSLGKDQVENITVEKIAFEKLFQEAGETTLITLHIESEKPRNVLISEVQKDPVTHEYLHISFFQVDMDEKITANIPIELINEDACKPVTIGEGILITLINEIEVECLPAYLPHGFQVDVSVLKNVEDTLTVEQAIKVDSTKIEIKVPQDEIIVKVDFAEQKTKEEEPASVEDVGIVGEEGKEEEPKEESDTDQ